MLLTAKASLWLPVNNFLLNQQASFKLQRIIIYPLFLCTALTISIVLFEVSDPSGLLVVQKFNLLLVIPRPLVKLAQNHRAPSSLLTGTLNLGIPFRGCQYFASLKFLKGSSVVWVQLSGTVYIQHADDPWFNQQHLTKM